MAGPQERSVVAVTSDLSNWMTRILLSPNRLRLPRGPAVGSLEQTSLRPTPCGGEAARTNSTSGQILRLLTRDLASLLGGTADGVGRSRAELAALLGGMAGSS
jgi:hypothetical protein